MSALLRQVVFPACRRLHQGTLAMFLPRTPQGATCRTCSSQSEPRRLTEEEEAQMRELFDEYDTDGSGEISRDELYEIVERVIGSHTSSMHIVDKILEDCDEDGNESITFEEFKSGIKSYMEFFLQTD